MSAAENQVDRTTSIELLHFLYMNTLRYVDLLTF